MRRKHPTAAIAPLFFIAHWGAIVALFTSIAQLNFGVAGLFATAAVWPLAMTWAMCGERR